MQLVARFIPYNYFLLFLSKLGN